MAANTNLGLVVPTTEEQTVAADMARRRRNTELRSREHLTPDEVERLIAAAKQGRWGHRDATMILVAYRHGLRASELTDLRWDQVDFSAANLHVRRAKKCSPATHPILGDELRAFAGCSGSKSLSHPLSSRASAAMLKEPALSLHAPGLKISSPLRFRQWDGERRHPQDADALHRSRGKATVDVRCPAQATAWQEDRNQSRDNSNCSTGVIKLS